MKFYAINHDGASEDGSAYFETFAEAKKAAREIALDSDTCVEVDRVEVGTLKSDIVRLASGRGWCLSRTPVYVARGKR